ncbi:MAG: NAD-dependent epimerase/dehydratase family protein [Bdellovibrionales bacterium]|nr:NAD-dependent epimerase/dehydratase family protein [Bdellovibrionales bacterium]
MAKSKWLVTGAAGFLGSHVVEQLLENGQEVLAVDDLSWGKEEFLNPYLDVENFDFYKTDIREVANVRRILEGREPDHIIHLAALHFIPLAMKQPTLTVDINVKGTQSLIEASRDIPFKSFWFASTGDVYKNTESILSEDETPLEPFNIYGLTKYMGEQLLHMESQDFPNKSYVVGRIFNLIGPRETNPHIIPEIIKQLRNNPKKLSLGNIWPIRDYVPVDDAARAIIAMCAKASPGLKTCNVATGVGQSVSDLIKSIEGILGHNIEVTKDEDRVRAVERPTLIAKVDRLKDHIGWAPTHKVEEILSSLLQAEGIL